MITKSVEYIIGRLKGNSQYSFETDLTLYEIMVYAFFRFVQASRGFLLLGVKRKGVLFIGKNVRIQFKRNFSCGRSCIIEDGVSIQALCKKGIVLEDNVTIARYSTLVGSGVIRNKGIGIKLHSNTAVGVGSFLGGQGGITIQENVIMGPGVKIFSENHVFDNKYQNIKDQGEVRSEVIIGRNCWIGAGVTILAGVEIAPNSVVAAGSVVTKSLTQEYAVYGGIPAKCIKQI